MILEFKTKINKNGNHFYLQIDTGNKKFTRQPQHMIDDGIVITKKDYDKLRETCEKEKYSEYIKI